MSAGGWKIEAGSMGDANFQLCASATDKILGVPLARNRRSVAEMHGMRKQTWNVASRLCARTGAENFSVISREVGCIQRGWWRHKGCRIKEISDISEPI
jgi:hypothetical protein